MYGLVDRMEEALDTLRKAGDMAAQIDRAEEVLHDAERIRRSEEERTRMWWR
jgi:hypothetical protein